MKRLIIITIILIIIPNISIGAETLIEEQLEVLNLGAFISEGEEYTKEVFENLDVKDMITKTLTGQIDNGIIYKGVLKVLGKEVVSGITILGSILVIIVIHSILKSIGENLGNEGTAKIAYFVEYILIITIIIGNFANIILTVKDTISNLVRIYEYTCTNFNIINNSYRTSCFRHTFATSIDFCNNNNRKYYKFNSFANNYSNNGFEHSFKFIW